MRTILYHALRVSLAILLAGGLLATQTSTLNEGCSYMGILYDHLRDCVVKPVLLENDLHSEAAEQLLLGTAAHESLGGHYLKQQGNGPALGIYQMEKATLLDMWDNWLRFNHELRERLQLARPDPERLMWDLRYATLWARLNYLRVKEPLPLAGDDRGLANYWFRYWCRGCKGTVSQWMADWQRYRITL